MSVSVAGLVVSVAAANDAPGMVEVIHAAFGARPPVDPPATANQETVDTLRAGLAGGAGIYATVDGHPAGSILIGTADNGRADLRRVSVHPDFQRHGIASAMVAAAEELAATRGFAEVELFARGEFAAVIGFWQHRGFMVERAAPYGFVLAKRLPVAVRVPSAEAMHDLGARLAGLLRRGDLIIAAGDLGAGKTTLTQGIGRGLDSDGPIISPTFVLSRIHPSRAGRPTLVHVDAYRLGSALELDDLDLDETLADAVTVIEWGQDLAEGLSDDRLEIDIWTAEPDDREVPDRVIADTSERVVTFRPVGPRWQAVDLSVLAGES